MSQSFIKWLKQLKYAPATEFGEGYNEAIDRILTEALSTLKPEGEQISAAREAAIIECAELVDDERADNCDRDIAAMIRALLTSPPPQPSDGVDAWQRIAADPELANARRKLSIHEIRLIIKHAKEAL